MHACIRIRMSVQSRGLSLFAPSNRRETLLLFDASFADRGTKWRKERRARNFSTRFQRLREKESAKGCRARADGSANSALLATARIIRIPVPYALSFLPFPLSLSPSITRLRSLRVPSLGPLSPSPSLCVALNPFPLRLPLRAASPRCYCPWPRSPARPIDPGHPRPDRQLSRASRSSRRGDVTWSAESGGKVGVRGGGGGRKVGDNNFPDNGGSPRSVYHSVSSAVSLTRGWGKLVLQPLLSGCSVWGRFIQRNCRERDTCWHVGPLTIPDTRARVASLLFPPSGRDSIRVESRAIVRRASNSWKWEFRDGGRKKNRA